MNTQAPTLVNRPAHILRENAIVCALAQVVAWSFLWYAIVSGRSLAEAFCLCVYLPPTIAWMTYGQCRRAWMGQPPDDLRDGSIPALIVAAPVSLLWLVLKRHGY